MVAETKDNIGVGAKDINFTVNQVQYNQVNKAVTGTFSNMTVTGATSVGITTGTNGQYKVQVVGSGTPEKVSFHARQHQRHPAIVVPSRYHEQVGMREALLVWVHLS